MADRLPIITEADVHAIRRVLDGQGSNTDQQHAMRFIGEQLCRRADSPYFPGASEMDTGFELGRHFVGVMISNMRDAATLDRARADDQARAEAKKAAASGMTPQRPPQAPRPTINQSKRRKT